MSTSPLAARLRALTLDQVETIALVLLDPDGIVVEWLWGSERLLGYTAAEIVGQRFTVLFVPEDLALRMDAWELATAARSGNAEDDRWQIRKDGARIWVSGTLNALRDDDGMLVGFAKLMRDRTETKAHLEVLERRILAARKTDDQRVQFVSTLAHELRNPIGTIANAVGILAQPTVSTPEIHFAASVVRRQVEFMTRMIDDLLEVARSAAGKVLLNKQRVSLQDVLARSVEACRSLIARREHLVHQAIPEGAILVDVDPVRLQQVFMNLIDNAAKYTPARGTIWIKATTEGNEAVVHIRDTGAGIAPDLMPDIFELFTQGEPAHRAGGGLGIGLALVKETIELHGGSVQATSDGVGKGSQFSIRLPVAGTPAS